VTIKRVSQFVGVHSRNVAQPGVLHLHRLGADRRPAQNAWMAVTRSLDVLQRRTDAAHVLLISRLAGPLSRAPDALEWWRETQVSDEKPERRSTYLYLVGTCWSKLALMCGVAVSLLGFGLAQVNDSLGYSLASTALVLTMGFCLTGLADTIWRSWLVAAARRRYRTANRKVDDRTRRLMRLARLNDGGLLLQFASAIFWLWVFS
jgi:hypothetical protein